MQRAKAKTAIKTNTGVIVGRFQVATLHQAHIDLINTVVEECDNVIIILGLSDATPSKRNPLDFQSRLRMIKEEFPDIQCYYIKNYRTDQEWSAELDKIIAGAVPKAHTVKLYGSRDSFIDHYSGRYETVELESETMVSGTEDRNAISKTVLSSKPFRQGVIYNTYARRAISYQTVDVLYEEFVDGKLMVLLGKRSSDPKHRFIGGFVDPTDSSLEAAAARELREEANIDSNVTYLGSFRVPDWRYANEDDQILTAAFSATRAWGNTKPRPGDDIDHIKWFHIDDIADNLVDEHLPIWSGLHKKYIIKEHVHNVQNILNQPDLSKEQMAEMLKVHLDVLTDSNDPDAVRSNLLAKFIIDDLAEKESNNEIKPPKIVAIVK